MFNAFKAEHEEEGYLNKSYLKEVNHTKNCQKLFLDTSLIYRHNIMKHGMQRLPYLGMNFG